MTRMNMIVLFLFLAVVGCTRSAITVDDERISKELFELTLKEKLGAHETMNINANDEAVKKAVTDELIAQALLLREAKAKKISVTDEEVRKTIDGMRGGRSEQEFQEGLKKKGTPYDIFQERVRRNLIISKLMASLVKDDSVTEEEMENLYQKRPGLYVEPEQGLVKILQISHEAEAKRALEELKKGADFDTLAKNLGDSGNASVSDYGWINPDMLPSVELATAMKTAKINVFSGPFMGRDGSYYFFKVKKRQASRVLSFEEAKPRVKDILLRLRRQDLAASIVQTGRKTAKIKINM